MVCFRNTKILINHVESAFLDCYLGFKRLENGLPCRSQRRMDMNITFRATKHILYFDI